MQHKLVSLIIAFDWDGGNYYKSLHKHEVSTQEAEEIFVNEPLVILDDEKHSDHEKRYAAYGKTNEERRLFAVFTLRKKRIRIISIRPMDKRERKLYEQEEA